MTNLFQFLADLATDPEMQERFRSEPDKLLEEVGLDDAEKAVLRSKDPNALAIYLDGIRVLGWTQPVPFSFRNLSGTGTMNGEPTQFRGCSGKGEYIKEGDFTKLPEES